VVGVPTAELLLLPLTATAETTVAVGGEEKPLESDMSCGVLQLSNVNYVEKEIQMETKK
jgi:hypothetical protein